MRTSLLLYSLLFSILLQACSNGSSTGSDASDVNGSTMGTPDSGSQTENCGADHPRVGQQATFNTLFHDVAGFIRIVDNCTLEITNFSYDGGGPDVAFYAYTDGNYFHPDAFRLGAQLNGRIHSGETITLQLPEEKSLDNFDSISVWCFQIGVSFGDAYLNQ